MASMTDISKLLSDHYGIDVDSCTDLDMPTNDAFAVESPQGKFILKIYNHQSRDAAAVQWEIDLINHLSPKGAPVAKPIAHSGGGHVINMSFDGSNRAAVLYEWAMGSKPTASAATFRMIGTAAGKIHNAADTFTGVTWRDNYDSTVLVDEQISRMSDRLKQINRLQQVVDMGERLKNQISNPELDTGVCHMDLTIDNVHVHNGNITVFDFDSAGSSWRAIEPHKILRQSTDYFTAWLDGYREVRDFSQADQAAASAFCIIGDLRVVAWDLGVAASSRGKPRLNLEDLSTIVDNWLSWESDHLR